VIIESLVRNYPSHGYVIDREELQELGLPARELSGEEGGIIERMEAMLRGLDSDDEIIERVDAVPSLDSGGASMASPPSCSTNPLSRAKDPLRNCRAHPELRAPSVLLSYCHGIPRTGTRG
jgi:hypothetical protein